LSATLIKHAIARTVTLKSPVILTIYPTGVGSNFWSNLRKMLLLEQKKIKLCN